MIPSVVAQQVRETILDYLRTTFALADTEFEEALFEFLNSDRGLFKGPYIDVRLPFKKGMEGESIPLDIQPPFTPHKHQVRSFQRLYSKYDHQPQHTLVTTGTGSGKTECFLYPILDHCWRHQDQPGIKAIILYPMNALATDQAGRLAEILWNDERLKGKVSAGLYVGGEGRHAVADEQHIIDKRDVLRDSPPDILLTNYKMLDFLLLRPEDRKLWQHNEPDTLRYLVLDELHTYDGAQGTDVACLIRRLKNRLNAKPSSVCCVGTSATIGDDDERSAKALTDFANKVFDAFFTTDSLITESRQTPLEILGEDAASEPEKDNEKNFVPYEASSDLLNPDNYVDSKCWLNQQSLLWLGLEDCSDRLLVAEKLRTNNFLWQLLKVSGGGSRSLDDIDSRLQIRDPEWAEIEDPLQRRMLLNSFLGLISIAKYQDEDRLVPLLSVQVQLWVRELRHLVCQVSMPDQKPEFGWASDSTLGADDEAHWLPIAYCRDCGQSGFASALRTNEAVLQEELPEIGRAWLHRSPIARYVRIGKSSNDFFPEYINPRSLVVGTEPTEQDMAEGTIHCIPALITAELSTQTPPRSLVRCPDCGGDMSLSMLGSRAPSLLSVAISDVFTSPYNTEKKLLAFTDSVQDASHRAGFFGARTYRFNLRTAIQGLLEKEESDIPLTKFAERMFTHWTDQVPKRRLIPTLLPPDLREHPRYKTFLESEGKGSHQRLQEDLLDRLSWELSMEYALKGNVGRTLESTYCSVLQVDPALLDKAARNLALELNEDGCLEGRSDDIDVAEMRHFLAGLLNRTRLRGGYYHDFLLSYIKSGGNTWHLRKNRNPLISPFGRFSIYPRFLTDFASTGGTRGAVFDSIVSPTKSQTWYRDWAARCLNVPLSDAGINELYKRVVSVLTANAVLREFPANSNSRVWAIDPSVASITTELAIAECADCNSKSVIPVREASHWHDMTCTMYRCKGMLSVDRETRGSYYSRIYRSGNLFRVFSEEHTGLLGRAEREDLEDAFRTQSKPDGPNLLVATPTLEMGIDIGDLSALVLCAMPPTTSNYVQRIGRAGRKTGNALCLTLVNARPHDLYFYEAPEEMMNGAIIPPGCFLDTPEMLKRQLVAHGMDAWSREDEQAGTIPPQVRYIKDAKEPARFPGRFIGFYRKHRQSLTDLFLKRFGAELSEENRSLVKAFGLGEAVPEMIIGAFTRVKEERKELTKTRSRISDQIRTLEKNKNEVADADIQLQDLRFARGVIGRLIEEQGSKYPLNVLTDEGALPNYAFPEAGVTLDSVIRDDKDDGSRQFNSREFVRPASSALREFAPFNTFYAEGRRVRIDEIDIGSPARPLTEKWRLCAECDYSERVTDDQVPTQVCPRCHDAATWTDAGQVRTLINFRRSRSLATRIEASTVDDSDDREEEYYKTADLIDVGPQNYHGAKLIADLPFGFELLKNLTVRECNFGREFDGGGTGLKVAGNPIGDRSFNVCVDCGKVAGINGATVDHAPYCKTRRTKQPEKIESIFLYRQVKSEAIRVLMPFASVSLDERRASFKAALELGFRRNFQGDPVHLQIKEAREPLPGGGHRQFLVIFDAVPGGTGYLSDLWRADNFMGVLQMALSALQSCECQKNERKDGCYRCLYAYQRQKELALISSRSAQQTLTEILGKRGELQDCHTLSEVSLDNRLESELETKFIQAIEARCGTKSDYLWSETIKGGEPRWRLTIGDCEWEIEAQVYLGSQQSVSIASKPDFLISRVNGGVGEKAIAVFCDGFAFHACPDKAEGRIWDDVDKRKSIIDSGRYLQWSIAWKDVEAFEQGKGKAPFAFEDTNPQVLNKLARTQSLDVPKESAKMSSMEQLWMFLASPDINQWTSLSNIWSVAWMASKPAGDSTYFHKAEEILINSDVIIDFSIPGSDATQDGLIGRGDRRDYFYMLISTTADNLRKGKLDSTSVVLRLDDAAGNRAAKDFEESWRMFLQALNLLQFKENVELQTTERIRYVSDDYEFPDSSSAVAEDATYETEAKSEAVTELIEYSQEQSEPFIRSFAETGLPLPTIDFNLDMGTGRFSPEAELSWPDLKIVILADNQLEDREEFESRGWMVFKHPLDLDEIVDSVKLKL